MMSEERVKEYQIGNMTLWLLSLRDLSDADLMEMYSRCGRERKEKAAKIKAEGKKKQAVGAGYLISLLKEQFSIADDPVILPQGKPVFPGEQKVHFSISHSGDRVVLAFGDSPLGVDIEFIRQANLKLAGRFFTREEYEHLLQQETERQGELFYRIWTGKEAVVKAAGCGLTLPLDGFSVSDETVMVSGKMYELHRQRFRGEGADFWISGAQLIKDPVK